MGTFFLFYFLDKPKKISQGSNNLALAQEKSEDTGNGFYLSMEPFTMCLWDSQCV